MTRPSTASDLTEQAEQIAETTPAVEQPAANVIEALRRVMRDLPAIGKDGRADPKQGGYAYRGIEQITAETQRLFARHGVVFTPHVRSWEIRDLVVNGKPWTDTICEVEYTIYGPGGAEDRIMVGPLLGIGRDNSDKGANKVLTQTFKYALLQALSISDAKDDSDGSTHEADPNAGRVVDPDRQARQEAALRLRALSPDERDVVRRFLDEHEISRVAYEWSDAEMEQVIEVLDELALRPTDDPEHGPPEPEQGTEAEA